MWYTLFKYNDNNLGCNIDWREFAGEGGRQRAPVHGLRVVHSPASQLLGPGKGADSAVDKPLAVPLFNLEVFLCFRRLQMMISYH